MNITWDATQYKNDFSFVAQYGKGVAELIESKPGAVLLDLGCGNGSLTAEFAACGFNTVGMDASAEMLALAREAHPELAFIEGNATSFVLDEPVDVVFSNAVLHWIDAKDQSAALACISRALKLGGEFVFEMGGYACCAKIHAALAQAFDSHGLPYSVPFYFPTIGEYAPLIEAAGMRPTFAALFDRPTPLVGNDGIAEWIRMFVHVPFEGMNESLKQTLIDEAVEVLRQDPTMFRDGTWYADYTRLRMRAVKL